jgi:hypothetical protein
MCKTPRLGGVCLLLSFYRAASRANSMCQYQLSGFGTWRKGTDESHSLSPSEKIFLKHNMPICESRDREIAELPRVWEIYWICLRALSKHSIDSRVQL